MRLQAHSTKTHELDSPLLSHTECGLGFKFPSAPKKCVQLFYCTVLHQLGCKHIGIRAGSMQQPPPSVSTSSICSITVSPITRDTVNSSSSLQPLERSIASQTNQETSLASAAPLWHLRLTIHWVLETGYKLQFARKPPKSQGAHVP